MHPKSSWFITITYDDHHLPGMWPDDERTLGSLDPDEAQRFLKRLRKRSQLAKFGYFLCGEYGGKTDRPHYHFASFGIPFLDKVEVGERNGYKVFQSETLRKAWPYGNHEITTLSFKAASYVAGYVMNKVVERTDPTKHLRVDELTGQIFEVEPEFQRMSRRPALGRKWLERYWQDVYPRDFVMMEGKPRRPPKYYDRWMETNQPEVMEEVRYQRFLDQKEIDDDQLIIQERVHRSRNKLFKRRESV